MNEFRTANLFRANDVGNHQTDASLNLTTYIYITCVAFVRETRSKKGLAIFTLVNSFSLAISVC